MKVLLVNTINNIPSNIQFQELAVYLTNKGHKVVHLSDSERPSYGEVIVLFYVKKNRVFSWFNFIKIILRYKPDLVLSNFSANNYVNICRYMHKFRWYAFWPSDFYNDYFYNNFRFRCLEKMIVLSTPMVSKLSNMFPHLSNKISVIPNSYNFIKLNYFEKKNIILHVGGITYYSNGKLVKGTDVLIEAYKILKTTCNFVPELWIVGDGPGLNAMKLLASDVHGIKFLGKIFHSEVLECMRVSKLFVLPSRNEAFGQVFLEAIQFGCSLIGTENTGAVDIVVRGNYGQIVLQDDVIGLSNAINHLFMSYELEGVLKAYNNKKVQFSRENWIKMMESELNFNS